MQKHSAVWAAVGVLALGTSLGALTPMATGSSGQDGAMKLRATLTASQIPGGQEKKVTGGGGVFAATLVGNKLSWKLTFHGLSGEALGAHIHIAPPGKSHWEPAIGLCGFLADAGQPASCTSGVHHVATIHRGFDGTSAAQVRRALLTGGAYVNIHTTDNYNWGEIRGQIEVVK